MDILPKFSLPAFVPAKFPKLYSQWDLSIFILCLFFFFSFLLPDRLFLQFIVRWFVSSPACASRTALYVDFTFLREISCFWCPLTPKLILVTRNLVLLFLIRDCVSLLSRFLFPFSFFLFFRGLFCLRLSQCPWGRDLTCGGRKCGNKTHTRTPSLDVHKAGQTIESTWTTICGKIGASLEMWIASFRGFRNLPISYAESALLETFRRNIFGVSGRGSLLNGYDINDRVCLHDHCSENRGPSHHHIIG